MVTRIFTSQELGGRGLICGVYHRFIYQTDSIVDAATATAEVIEVGVIEDIEVDDTIEVDVPW
jgi:hypothetical protein